MIPNKGRIIIAEGILIVMESRPLLGTTFLYLIT